MFRLIYEYLTSPEFIGEALNVLLAFVIMYLGWILYAAVYFLRTKKLNGYTNKKKIAASSVIMIILAIVLIGIPDVSEALKLLLGVDIDIENSKAGFLTLGIALSGIVSAKLKTTEEPFKFNVDTDNCPNCNQPLNSNQYEEQV